MWIEFGELTGKNILSFGSGGFTLDFSKEKLTLITGKNGRGKSTIIEALTYCLFGKPYRKVKLGQLINSVNGKGLLVSLGFKIGQDVYKIVRGIKPNLFEIYKNEELIPEEAATKDYQTFLEDEILGFGYKTFKQVCVIGSASYTQFMTLSAGERRVMIEELLDISIFSKMLAIAKEEVSSAKKEVDLITNKVRSRMEEHTRLVSLLESIKEGEEKKKTEYVTRMNEIEKEKESHHVKLEEYKVLIDGFLEKLKDEAEILEKQSSLKSKLHMNVADIGRHKKTISFFDTNDTCPTCNQELAQSHCESIINSEKESVAKILSESKPISTEIEENNAKIAEFAKLTSALTRLQGMVSSTTSLIRQGDTELSSIRKELDRDNESDKVTEKITEVSNVIATDTERKSTLLEEFIVLDACLSMLKDNGIKARIIAKFVPLINQLINQHLELFDLFVNFELDENFDETIRSRHRDAFTYDSFSEGEKSKIDLSILFTWREIAKRKNSVSCNLLFFDETLDSSLDTDSIGTFLDLLKETEGTNVLIISHRESDPVMFDRVLLVDKKSDGFSVIEEVE